MQIPLPKAILLDLDDTILNDSGNVEHCWRDACHSCVDKFGGIDVAAVLQSIDKTRGWFWSDPDRHRVGRLNLEAARYEIVRMALRGIGVDRSELARTIVETYSRNREAKMELLPGAIETIRWFRQTGCRLALVTNGNGEAQRKKLTRFSLTDHFDTILIEGELGFGKPDERVYQVALRTLTVSPGQAWMVGDNLEWDVAQPQRMGMIGIWVNAAGTGVPSQSTVRPDRIVRTLSEMCPS
jgi:putative hydrolase of the HAD superfamily